MLILRAVNNLDDFIFIYMHSTKKSLCTSLVEIPNLNSKLNCLLIKSFKMNSCVIIHRFHSIDGNKQKKYKNVVDTFL